jgi:hypothetical protein
MPVRVKITTKRKVTRGRVVQLVSVNGKQIAAVAIRRGRKGGRGGGGSYHG